MSDVALVLVVAAIVSHPNLIAVAVVYMIIRYLVRATYHKLKRRKVSAKPHS